MGALTDLSLDTAGGAIMCIAAPDSVLAEAGAMKPRPSFASTLLTAEPTPRLVWWPERRHLESQTLARLKWLIETAAGHAWLILDADEDESPSESELRSALETNGLTAEPALQLGRGEVAVLVTGARS